MTTIHTPVPAQNSAFNSAIASLFSAALLIAVGALTFTAFLSA